MIPYSVACVFFLVQAASAQDDDHESKPSSFAACMKEVDLLIDAYSTNPSEALSDRITAKFYECEHLDEPPLGGGFAGGGASGGGGSGDSYGDDDAEPNHQDDGNPIPETGGSVEATKKQVDDNKGSRGPKRITDSGPKRITNNNPNIDTVRSDSGVPSGGGTEGEATTTTIQDDSEVGSVIDTSASHVPVGDAEKGGYTYRNENEIRRRFENRYGKRVTFGPTKNSEKGPCRVENSEGYQVGKHIQVKINGDTVVGAYSKCNCVLPGGGTQWRYRVDYGV